MVTCQYRLWWSKAKLEILKNRLLSNHVCQRFTSKNQLTSVVVADLGRHIAMQEIPRVGPGIELLDIGVDSIRGTQIDSPDEWNDLRNEIYNQSRGIALTHVIQPSNKVGQDFDIFIYL